MLRAACGLGSGSARRCAGVGVQPPGAAPRCTTYAVPVPASSARSGRHMPHRLPGFKHPLTNASPSLKRTRTTSCTFHSGGASQSSWPPALGGGRYCGGDRFPFKRLGSSANQKSIKFSPILKRNFSPFKVCYNVLTDEVHRNTQQEVRIS